MDGAKILTTLGQGVEPRLESLLRATDIEARFPGKPGQRRCGAIKRDIKSQEGLQRIE